MKPAILAIFALNLLRPEAAQANYQAATASFAKRDYVSAASQYFMAYTAPKSRSERMKAEWGLAQSLQFLRLPYSASKYYSIIVRRGAKRGNPFFRQAMEQLGVINSNISLGQAHVVQLFNSQISAADVPREARGFYFYYLGVESFGKRQFGKAKQQLEKVPSGSPYHLGAIFHLGVIENLSGRHSRSISYFERVLAATENTPRFREIREAAILNVARIHYETRRYERSLDFYRQIPRDSDHWLDAIWETSWAFFFMQKFNNTLGGIHTLHSPFYFNRFYPESFILQSITFLRLCRYDQVKESMRRFKERYAGVFGDVKTMLERFRGNPRGFFKVVQDYNQRGQTTFRQAAEVLKSLSQIDAYKEATDTLRFSDRELAYLRQFNRWSSSGLLDELRGFLRSKKKAAVFDSGRRLFKQATGYYAQLLDLSSQTKLIVAEMQLGKLQELRDKINVGQSKSKVEFIGGLQKLKIGQSLEYWPFEGEYWEDELGYYVYNMESKCGANGAEEK